MDERNGSACAVDGVAGEVRRARPASRALAAASGGDGSPEATYRTLMALPRDILAGAISPGQGNAACNAVLTGIEVAKNADLMAEMHQRCAGQQAVLDAEIAATRRHLANLEASRAA